MMSMFLFIDGNVPQMNVPFSPEAIATFMKGLKVMGIGMSTVIGVLLLFYIIVKLLLKIFPEKEE